MADHTIIFDSVKTNIGTNYNVNIGMFFAPTEGLYYFSWTIHSRERTMVSTRLMVNNVMQSNIVTDSDEVTDWHSATGVAVLHLNQGDVVYIKSHPGTNGVSQHGNIMSDDIGRSTFCGFLLY